MDAQPSLLDRLFANGILYESGVDGLYGRSGVFEDVIARFEALVLSIGHGDGAEGFAFPPGMSRAQFEGSGYMKNFPQLAGTIHSFCGNDHDHAELLRCMGAGEDWTAQQKATDLVLTPAACYPLYPVVARRGRLPANGVLAALQSYCFRHEPSRDPARMQMFRMREYVRMGSAEQVLAFRESWLERGPALMEKLELPCHIDVANDPFFGRAGRMMGSSQRDQGLKFELLIPISASGSPTACMSFNYHQDHFGKTFGLTQADGSVAHTACVGFGLERLALALFRHHGTDVSDWPSGVRRALWG